MKKYIQFEVIKIEFGDGNITYRARVMWFEGERIACREGLFGVEDDGFKWIAEQLKKIKEF